MSSRQFSCRSTAARNAGSLPFALRLLALGLLICAVAFAQSTTEGAIAGTVTDTSGAVVPNATIMVHNNATNAEHTVASDSSGAFRVGSLSPAIYSITVTASGFSPYKAQQVIVNVGTVTDVSPKLNVGGTSEIVNVNAEAPQVNTTSADFAPVLNNTAISNLPINGNRWSNFVLLTPTVVNDGSGFGLVSFRGMSVLLNNNTVDGADNNQAFFSEERGRTRAGYSSAKAAVQEFQVNTSNYSAEYGRSAGGVINTVTKSGTNSLHGEMYFYDRDNSWGATNPFTLLTTQTSPGVFTPAPYKPTDVRKISGFALGGPIKKDKLFFFLAFDWYKRTFPGTSVPSSPAKFYAAPTAATLTSLGANLGAAVANCGGSAAACYNAGLTGLLSENGPVPREGEQFIWFPKFDWQVNNKNHVALEFNRMRWASPAGIQTQATNTFGIASFGNDYVKTTWGIVRLDTAISNSISNQVRYQYGRDFEFENPQSPTPYEKANFVTSANFPGYTNPLGFPPDVFITNGFDMGVATFLTRPKYPDEYRHQIADTMSWAHGKHLFKFGMDFSHVNDTAQNLRFQFGSYSYGSILNYLSDLYKPNSCGATHTTPCFSSYTQAFGPLGFQFATNDYAWFLQDDWRVLPRLTLSLGLRYEYEQPPNPFANLVNPAYPQTGKLPSDKNNFGPRIGFAWDVFGDAKTSLRGGFGVYYGRLINSTIYNAVAQTGVSAGQLTYNLSTSSAASLPCVPKFPQILTTTPACPGAKPAVFFFDSHFQMPQIGQVDLSLEREVGWNTVVSLAYLGSFGRHLPSFLDVNLNPPTSSITYAITDANNEGPLRGTYGPIPVYTGNRPNTNFGAVTNIFSGVNSNYNAMVFQVNHRMNKHVQFMTSLTWSHALDYAQNEQTFTDTSDFLYPTDANGIRSSYGQSQFNVPLRYIFNAVAESPWHKNGAMGLLVNGWQIAPIYQWQNGLQYSLQESGSPSGTVQGGLTGSGTGSGYTSAQGNFSGFNFIPGIGRNTFRGPNTAIVDLKLSKNFSYKEHYSVEFSGEAFNLLNHVNYTGIATTGYLLGGSVAGGGTMTYCGTANPCSAVFGARTNANSNFAYTPRQVQLGVRVKF